MGEEFVATDRVFQNECRRQSVNGNDQQVNIVDVGIVASCDPMQLLLTAAVNESFGVERCATIIPASGQWGDVGIKGDVVDESLF